MAQEGPGVQGSQVEIAEVGAEFGPELLAQALAPGPYLLQQAGGVLGEPGQSFGTEQEHAEQEHQAQLGQSEVAQHGSQL